MDSALLPLHEWSSLRTELIWIYDRRLPPQALYWRGTASEMPGYRCWLIRKGSVTIRTRSGDLHFPAGTWVTPFKRAPEVLFSPDAHLISIHFLCQWPSGENVLKHRGGLSFASSRYPEMERTAKELEKHLKRRFPESAMNQHVYNTKRSSIVDFVEFQSLFLRWLAVWLQAQLENGANLTRLSSGDDRSFRAARLLNLAALDEPFPASALQKESGLGLMRLNQLFSAEFGLTTRKFWDRRRTEFAVQCLETSRMPIKEIAGRLGFRSSSHFVIWFRRQAEVSPGEYRSGYLAKSVLP